MTSKGWYVASGLKEDCTKLINRFEQLENVRFEGFCKIWREMKFSLVFTRRRSYLELLEFCEEAMHVAKLFLLPPYRFKERIGGLYLVYGLFSKMPIDIVKIRVKYTDWQNILELYNCIKEGEHLDAYYIFVKLLLEDAFVYCIFDHEYILERANRVLSVTKVNHFSLMSNIKDLVEQGELSSKISALSKLYQEQKCAISNSEKPKRGMELFDHNFIENIAGDIKELESSRQSAMATYVASSSEGTSSSAINAQQIARWRSNRVRPKLGHGFDTDSSEEELSSITVLEGYDADLPHTFDELSDDLE